MSKFSVPGLLEFHGWTHGRHLGYFHFLIWSSASGCARDCSLSVLHILRKRGALAARTTIEKVGGTMVRIRVLASLLAAIALTALAGAQSKESLVGTWRLVSVTSTTIKGDVNPTAFGQHPAGFATFTPEGRMTLIMCDDGRKPLSVVDRVSAPAEERAQAFATFVAYAGSYTFTGDKVVFHVEAASIQNWVHTDLTRLVTFQKDGVTLRTMTTLKGGVLQAIETNWQRVN